MKFLQRLSSLVAGIGHDPHDPAELRLQKRLIVTASFMFIVAGAAWGVMYFALGQWLAGTIPLGYAMVSVLSALIFARTRNYYAFRFSQLLLILLLPFLLQITLGGFVNSSAVILWALVCPIGALVFSNPRAAVRWFLAYLTLVAISGALEKLFPVAPLPQPVILLFFVLNIAAISTVAFVLLAFFIGEKDLAFRLLHAE
jgi:adenylate cyclase